MADLKPCPFCGGKACKTTIFNSNKKTYYQISCPDEDCSIQPFTDYRTEEEVVIQEWNRRANDV